MSERIATQSRESAQATDYHTDFRQGEEANTVLGLLADRDARAILMATAREAVSVPELVTVCEIPTATAYRKVEALVDTGLLTKNIRIRPHGRNANEYQLRPRSISIDISEHGEPFITIAHAQDRD